jgi:hypothetical protein
MTMAYDLFISYSRRDNEQGRITQLVERIKTDFAPFAERELVPFFDQDDNPLSPALRSGPMALSGASPTKRFPSSQPPFSRPPVRPNGSFRGLTDKAIS